MKLAYSTLACPDWTWEQILDSGARYGFEGVEVRLIGPEMDLTRTEPFAPARPAETRQQLADAGLSLVCLGSSCRLHEGGAGLDHARAYIDLASSLGAPFVRVFPDKLLPDRPEAESIALLADGLRTLARYVAPRSVTVLMETHGDLVRSPQLAAVLTQANHPHAGILWDTHNTWRMGAESPSHTWSQIGRWVRHYHVKDSVATAERAYQYVHFGQGEYPVVALLELLGRHHPDAWLSLEHEKKWHPALPAPEEALAVYTAYFAK